MKTIITALYLLLMGSNIYSQIIQKDNKSIDYLELTITIENSIKENLPVRFNATRSLRKVFYNKCDKFPKHCQKLRFYNINDVRILEIDSISNLIKVSLDFSYGAEDIQHYATAILESKIKLIGDLHQLDYIKIIGTKGMYEYYTPLRNEQPYILNKLSYNNY